MYRGTFGGVGSGVGISYEKKSINLISIFRTSKQERESTWNQRDENSINHISMNRELREQWKKVCANANAFIYVCERGLFPTNPMIEEFENLTSSAPKVPIALVVPDKMEGLEEEEKATPLDYLNSLQDSLCLNSRPWWLYSMKESPSSLKPIFQWLLDSPSFFKNY